MADIQLDASMDGNYWDMLDGRDQVVVSAQLRYVFYVDSTGILKYRKSTNDGSSYAAEVAFITPASGTITHFSVWFDRWNGGTGDLIHVAAMSSGEDDTFYRNLNVTSDAQGTQRTVFAGTGVTGPGTGYPGSWLSITKASGGNLYVAFRQQNSASTEAGFYRSVDVGVNWTSRTNVFDGASDRIILLTKKGGGADIWGLYLDITNKTLTLKEYADGGNTWSESSTIHTLVGIQDFVLNFAGVVRQSDGHVIAAFWTDSETATGDLVTYDITDRSTWSQKTDVITNSAVYPLVSLTIDQNNDTIYVHASTATGINGVAQRYTSSNGMTSWSGPTAYQETTGTNNNLGVLGSCYEISQNGGAISASMWFENLADLLINFVNRVSVGATPPGVQVYPATMRYLRAPQPQQQPNVMPTLLAPAAPADPPPGVQQFPATMRRSIVQQIPLQPVEPWLLTTPDFNLTPGVQVFPTQVPRAARAQQPQAPVNLVPTLLAELQPPGFQVFPARTPQPTRQQPQMPVNTLAMLAPALPPGAQVYPANMRLLRPQQPQQPSALITLLDTTAAVLPPGAQIYPATMRRSSVQQPQQQSVPTWLLIAPQFNLTPGVQVYPSTTYDRQRWARSVARLSQDGVWQNLQGTLFAPPPPMPPGRQLFPQPYRRPPRRQWEQAPNLLPTLLSTLATIAPTDATLYGTAAESAFLFGAGAASATLYGVDGESLPLFDRRVS